MTNEEYINELKKLREKRFSLDKSIEKLDKIFEKYKNDEILVKLTLKELKVIDSAFADWECNSSNYLIDYNQYQIWIKLNNILLKMLEKRGGEK